jgi:serine/threonine protein kinase
MSVLSGCLHRTVRPGRGVARVARVRRPNVAALHDVVRDDGSYWLVMDYHGGGTLAALLRGGRLRSLGATLYASVEGRPPRWDVPSTLASVLPDSPPPAPHAGSLWPVLAGLMVGDPARRPTHEGIHAQLTISGPAACTPATRGGAGLHDGPAARHAAAPGGALLHDSRQGGSAARATQPARNPLDECGR